MRKDETIYVAGHKGLVGSAIWHNLQQKGYTHLIGKTSQELDLRDAQAVEAFFAKEKPQYVFLAAAKVGGIMANSLYRADFIYQNLGIQQNIIGMSYKYGVKKLLFLGSTCIYPANAPQPMTEDCLLTSPLEYTNEPYALAKIAGIKLCESFNLQYGTNYISVMPTNLYGPNDNFHLETSHVLPALLRKIYLGRCLEANQWPLIREDLRKRPIDQLDHTASQDQILQVLAKYGLSQNQKGEVSVEIWGTGKPLREFLWSEEMADACVYVMEKVDFADLKGSHKDVRNTHINIGTGKEISIYTL
ncbi:MAG: GDP-L-fucose synthase, partial [Bacteroidales bacterium]